ncbi:aromatic-ring hydroxylase C-terminal domain-containing protein [Streptomyces sp. NPDC055078]
MELSAEPGTRAPHLWVRRAGERLSTLDLYERVPVLLCGEGSDWRDAARKAAARLSVPLDVYAIGDGPLADLVPEEGGDWAGTHRTTPEGALLVRPDGFVAWRSPGGVLEPEAAVADALARVLSLDTRRTPRESRVLDLEPRVLRREPRVSRGTEVLNLEAQLPAGEPQRG